MIKEVPEKETPFYEGYRPGFYYDDGEEPFLAFSSQEALGIKTKENDAFSIVASQQGEPQADMVNHPAHYDMPIETFEMFLLLYHDRPDFVKGALLFNIFKYRDRADRKNGLEDVEKMRWYQDKFETLFEEDALLAQIYRKL